MTSGIIQLLSIRQGFRRELEGLGRTGRCLLPEWICREMSDHVEAAGWQPVFIKVMHPGNASVPLQLNMLHLLKQLRKLSFVRDPVVILLAHPMGYVDPGIEEALKNGLLRKACPRVRLVLDLAQSYGVYDFGRTIQTVDSTYVSFNGRKLISLGGALKLGPEVSGQTYKLLMHSWSKAASEQLVVAKQALCNLAMRYPDVGSALEAGRARFPSSLRSNAHRLFLSSHCLNDVTLDALGREGFAQALLANPQGRRAKESLAYRDWAGSFVLLFHEQRIPSYEQANHLV